MSERGLWIAASAFRSALIGRRRSTRLAIAVGVASAVIVVLVTEVIAAVLRGSLAESLASGSTHVVAVALGILLGYAVAIPIGIERGMRARVRAAEILLEESEKLEKRAIREAEALGSVSGEEAFRLGRSAVSDFGSVIGGMDREMIGGVGGAIEQGIERGVAAHLPVRHENERETSDAHSPQHETESPAPGGRAVPPAAPAADAASSENRSPLERLHFTAFHPREVAPRSWNSFFVYTHIARALAAVKMDAAHFARELGTEPLRKSVEAIIPMSRGVTITIVPECEDVAFNPRRQSFTWPEDWHRADFRFRAGSASAGTALNIKVQVFLDLANFATIVMPVLCLEDAGRLPSGENREQAEATMHTRIFMSYSHEDAPIVTACRNTYQALGLTILRDRDTLKPGEQWRPGLQRMIDESEVFQLFWSARSAASSAVREEWEYAVTLGKGEEFIRPVYWEEPLAPPPQELAPLNFYYVPLPSLVTG